MKQKVIIEFRGVIERTVDIENEEDVLKEVLKNEPFLNNNDVDIYSVDIQDVDQ